jgi:gamma-glutamylcyclotransferase (GGCT)/AIG2-like uncharacterized protein YtfP
MAEKTERTYEMATTAMLTPGRVRVFVYGSLKRGHGNHVVLSDAHYVGMGAVTLSGRMVDLGAFPGVIRQRDAAHYEVKGEIYEVDEDTLNALDYLEGHPRFYRRDKYKTANGIRVWMYTLPDAESYDRCEYVESGIWRADPGEDTFWSKAHG